MDNTTPVTAVDIHAHFVSIDPLPDDGTAPLCVVDPAGGRVVRGGSVLRALTSAAWDVGDRLRIMDNALVSHQVISTLPVMMEHAWQADPAYARALNDSLAAACNSGGGRLWGLGCLAAAAPLSELERCLELGLRGIMVGTRMGSSDLDDPELQNLWAACDEAGACVFVHPVDGGRRVLRRAAAPLDTGLGMITDTAMAAYALVFGGVLQNHPTLRVALAHGCGTFAWAAPRLHHVVAAAGDDRVRNGDWETLTRRLYADTLVLDPSLLALLERRLGPNRLLLGSDSPLLPLDDAVRVLDRAFNSGDLSTTSRRDLMASNALEFLGLTTERGAAADAALISTRRGT
ncbi:amidohydrolase family protein [Rhodococcus sp. IEGM 1307]|uniref:amidohydrolase family protein n=1 Tax=Rhodococcus sp. IEGM 1307 TaxID=3047091 RepID=UPI0024B708CE|nr:amidohydrolase family protein [Rhodococcus sp. IEGM 1307]MDI9977376.1 amidohydrolase family protein [Rhodococcus sp. IEGM 1307]